MQYLLLLSIGIALGMGGMKGCEEYFKNKDYPVSPVNENSRDKIIKNALVIGVIAGSVLGSVIITKAIIKKI
jgi:hypothetical protein